MVADYVPDAGDIVWLTFSPQAGREQAGRRPALVVSPRAYNEKVGLMIACPITSKPKDYPFEVKLDPSMQIAGAVLADHVKSQDWRARLATFIEQGGDDLLNDVRRLIILLVEPN